ncbi:hypothetical protein [Pseudalkalibacillus hwajinpoensis]|uniref:hypothetical protein n=1 Tax=Guptibacillus hwajinpoensis TaxID=208199 RepID=UPI00146CD1DB|nr:hypothetical protein [Pseudalkalibacillus hwajinpoensis]
MSLKTKVSLILLPLLFITLSILKFSGNLNATIGFLVVLLSGLSGLLVNRFSRENKNTK